MQSVLLLRYFKWHYAHATGEILKAWAAILWFNLNYFSVGLLLESFFSPWRRIVWDYGRGFDVGRYLFIFASNLVSRILGAVMRSFLIVAGVAIELLLVGLGILLLLAWFLLPLFIGTAFYYGVTLLF